MRSNWNVLLHLLLPCIFTSNSVAQTCILNGSFTSPTSEKKIILDGGRINKVIDIGPDGRFSAELEFGTPTWTLIHTENGNSWILWLDNGTIDVLLQEQIYSTKSGTKRMLSINSIKGPIDTEAREYFIKRTNQLVEKYESKDSISSHLVPEIEAFIRARPSSGLIPDLLIEMSQNLEEAEEKRLLQLATNLNGGQMDTASLNKLNGAFERLTKLQPGMRFPSFRMQGIDGSLHDLNELKADYIAVYFWASWCAPCRANAAGIRSLLEKTSRDRLQMVLISLDDDSVAWRKAIEQDGIPVMHLSELKGFQTSLAASLFINAIPYLVLLNRKGEIVKADISVASLETLIIKK